MWPFINKEQSLAKACVKHYKDMKRAEARLIEAKTKLLELSPEEKLIRTAGGSVRVKELQRVRVDIEKVKKEIGIENLLKLCNIPVNKLMRFMNNSQKFNRVVLSKTPNRVVIINTEENMYGRKI